jgi:predicted negative regulator of RcsB-dependent stress response
VDDYLSEKEQIQKLRQWWSENGAFVIAGLVLGIGGLSGWNYWQSWKLNQAEQAAALYGELVAAADAGDRARAGTHLDALVADYGATPYVDQGRLMLARANVEQGDLERAAVLLRTVVDTTDDPELERIGRIRLAWVLSADERPDEALDVLDLDRAGIFAARFHELRGDILAERGDRGAAREEYGLALATGTTGVVDRQAVQLKLDGLGAAVSPEEQDNAS